MKNEKLKLLIELADTVEEADSALLREYPAYNTWELKLAFLSGMFSYEIIGRNNVDLEADYFSVLTAIINQKWR